MKLGEALTLRARNAQKLNELTARITTSALVQEGDEPAESVGSLLSQYESLSEEQSRLVEKITRANLNSELVPTILQREHLRRLVTVHKKTLVAASATPNFYSRAEIRWVRQVDVAEIQAKVDSLENASNALDAKLQAQNWEIDLPE